MTGLMLGLLGAGWVSQGRAQGQMGDQRTIEFAEPVRAWMSGAPSKTRVPFRDDGRIGKGESRFSSAGTSQRAGATTAEFASALTTGEGSGESSSLATAGELSFAGASNRRTYRDIVPVYDHPVRPFAEFGMALKFSSLGPGVDLTTTLLRNWNLRGSANFVDFGLTIARQGVNYFGDIHLRSGQVNLDYFPRHGGFHISPGLLIFDHQIMGGIYVPGGMTYTLEDETFTSSPTDPITGLASLKYQRRVAPSLMIGFANIIPRSGKRWTVPVEFGLAYVGRSAVDIVLKGTACQPGGCFDVSTDADSQANLQEQLSDINSDLKRVQVYPLLSIGVGYRF